LLVGADDVIFRAVTIDSLFAWHSLTPRVSLVVGNGANSVVVADGHDVLLVDTKETGFGGALRREVERTIGRPVTRVVSTHHHTDHAMGNLAFTADVPVIAQHRARDRTIARAARAIVEMAARADRGLDPFDAHVTDLRDWTLYYGRVRIDDGVRAECDALVQKGRDAARGITESTERLVAVAPIAERFAPTETFESEHALRVGGIDVELHHWGPGHTDGDVVVSVPSDGIVVASDLVYVGLQPFIDVAGGARTDEWIRRTGELLELCSRLEREGRAVIVVPGHGATAGVEAVATQCTYFERLGEAMDAARGAGRSRADAVRLAPRGLPAERAELLEINLGIVFDELAKAASR
jgi:glyoxylase-like metal-dependent hydrolase (beta-lactamase superfamily II)